MRCFQALGGGGVVEQKPHPNPTYPIFFLAQLNSKLTLHAPRYTVFCMLSRRILAPLLCKLVSKKGLAYMLTHWKENFWVGRSLVYSIFELTITTSAIGKRRFPHTLKRTKTCKDWLWNWTILFYMNCSALSPLLPIALYTFLLYFCSRNYLHKINLDDIMWS